MFPIQSSVLAFAFMAGVAVSVAGQTSLGELARQEEARRSTVKHAGRVYTNADLGGEAASPTEGDAGRTAPPPAAAPASPTAKTATPATPDASAAKKDEPNDEKTWRERIAQARDQLARSKMFLDALQSRINGLTADFAARDDPAQRASITGDRQKALAELERVRRDIDQQTKAITDIQDEARRAGVPPGWVR